VHDQGWDIELLEVLGEISLGEGLDAFIGVLEAGLHAPESATRTHSGCGQSGKRKEDSTVLKKL